MKKNPGCILLDRSAASPISSKILASITSVENSYLKPLRKKSSSPLIDFILVINFTPDLKSLLNFLIVSVSLIQSNGRCTEQFETYKVIYCPRTSVNWKLIKLKMRYSSVRYLPFLIKLLECKVISISLKSVAISSTSHFDVNCKHFNFIKFFFMNWFLWSGLSL